MIWDEEQQEIANDYFDGDKELYQAYCKQQNRLALSWSELKDLPDFKEHDETARYFISRAVGYLPDLEIYLPHIAHIRAAIAYEKSGKLSYDSFYDEVTFHMMNIRNCSIIKSEWNFFEPYAPQLYELYHEDSKEVIERVHDRLTKILGYKPELEYSIEAEILLREYTSINQHYVDIPLRQYFDYQAAELVQYRKEHLTKGRQAANNLPLISLTYEDEQAVLRGF